MQLHRVGVGQKSLGVAGPVVEKIGDSDRFGERLAAWLATLRLNDAGDAPAVVEHPILERQQPGFAALRANRFPFGLKQAKFPGRGGDRISPLVRHFTDEPPVGGIAHFDVVRMPSFQSFSRTLSGEGDWWLVFLPSRRQRSGVAGCLLDELHPGGQPELGVDVGEVGLHGSRRHEKPGGNVFVGQPFAD